MPSTFVLTARAKLLGDCLTKAAGTDKNAERLAPLTKQLFFRAAEWRSRWPHSLWRRRPRQRAPGSLPTFIAAFEECCPPNSDASHTLPLTTLWSNFTPKDVASFVRHHDVEPRGYTTVESLLASDPRRSCPALADFSHEQGRL